MTEDTAASAIRAPQGVVAVRIDTTPDENGWCFVTPANHPDDIARGESEWNESAQFYGQVHSAKALTPAPSSGEAEPVDQRNDLQWVMQAVLYHFGPEGTKKVCDSVLEHRGRPLPSPSGVNAEVVAALEEACEAHRERASDLFARAVRLEAALEEIATRNKSRDQLQDMARSALQARAGAGEEDIRELLRMIDKVQNRPSHGRVYGIYHPDSPLGRQVEKVRAALASPTLTEPTEGR